MISSAQNYLTLNWKHEVLAHSDKLGETNTEKEWGLETWTGLFQHHQPTETLHTAHFSGHTIGSGTKTDEM